MSTTGDLLYEGGATEYIPGYRYEDRDIVADAAQAASNLVQTLTEGESFTVSRPHRSDPSDPLIIFQKNFPADTG